MEKWFSATAFAQHEQAPALAPDVSGCTVRTEIECGLSGKAFRLVFEELYSPIPVEYMGVVVGIGGKKTRLTFAGEPGITVHPGQRVFTDRVNHPIIAGERLILWISWGSHSSRSEIALEQQHSAKGDYCWDGFSALPYQNPLPGAPFNERLCGLKELQVETSDNAYGIAAFGDSITESGVWLEPLRRRIRLSDSNAALLNLGIGGNRLLRGTNIPSMPGIDVFGRSGLNRLDSDVFSLNGVKSVIVALGINDISQPGGIPGFSPPESELCSLDELQNGLKEVVSRCRAKGLTVIGVTITPFKGIISYNTKTAQLRLDINHWIKESNLFDYVLDFAEALADPKDHDTLFAEYDSGDHLHPNSAGGAAAAEAIDVGRFLLAVKGSK